MIKYDKLWKTMKEKGITQYDLYTRYNVNRSQLARLRHNKMYRLILLINYVISLNVMLKIS